MKGGSRREQKQQRGDERGDPMSDNAHQARQLRQQRREGMKGGSRDLGVQTAGGGSRVKASCRSSLGGKSSRDC